ncbi:SDR family NAD(P)-dependent oxidoreductase [Eubacterium aggregans]|uniref:SDR family NAD(P)-dependent oxidoreductase n=1 Tax=Eubacterium aggregans TaxID=81409 RepID=UPI003F3D119D
MAGKHAGQVIIITGSDRGIGYTMAEYLDGLGASVLIADIDEGAAVAAASGLSGDALALGCNIMDEASVAAMVDGVMAKYGRIDVLINNAGIFPAKIFSAMTFKDWKAVIDIDLNGTFLVTHAVYEVMEEQKSGKIVNVASIAGRVGGFGFTHYSAAKGGVIAFTKAMAWEAAKLGIQVNALAPGVVVTGMAKSNFPQYALDEHIRVTPAGRLGKPEDLLGAVSFLSSPESDYVVGQVLTVDGGDTMI